MQKSKYSLPNNPSPFEQQLYAEYVRNGGKSNPDDSEIKPFKLRILADECVWHSPLTIRDLRHGGYDVAYSKRALKDPEVYAEAKRTKRILFTHDRDFWDNERFEVSSSPGIIIVPARGGKFVQPSYLEALDYFSNKLPQVPCWWFFKKIMFRRSGILEICSPAPRLQRRIDDRPYNLSVHHYIP